MSIVLSARARADQIGGGRRVSSGDACNSVHEARWLLGPVFALAAAILAAACLFA